MKIALCFSGNIRDINETKNFWIDLIKEYDMDVYASFWDVENEEKGDTLNNFLKIYTPKKYEVENYRIYKETTQDIASLHIQSPKVIMEHLRKSSKAFGQLPMYYKVWRCNILSKQLGIDYDIVIRARTDIVLDDKFKIEKNKNLNVTAVANATHIHNAFIKWIPGAGNGNLVDGVVYGNTTINGNTVQTLTWNIPETFGAVSPTLNAPNVNITFEGMMSHQGNAAAPAHWHVDESHNFNEEVIVYRGGTYRFQVTGSESNHPLYITTSNANSFSSGAYVGEYTTGISNSRATSGNTLTWIVANNAPNTLHYQCGNHAAMRGNIIVRDLQVNLSGNGIPKVYLQHLKNGMYNEIIIDDPIAGDLAMSFLWKDEITGKWIPKNFVDYANTTSEFINWVAGQADARIVANKPTFERHFHKTGTLTVSAGTQKWYVPGNITLTSVKARLETAPAGSNARFVIVKNGANFITLNITSTQSSSETYNVAANINNGDYITVDTAAAGSGVPGADLTVTFLYTRN